MRKKLFIAAAAVIALLLFAIGLIHYRQYSSYNIPVHEGAATIIKINADAFIKTCIETYGLDFRRKIFRKDKKWNVKQPTGIFIPGNIFIYSISSKRPSTFFCTIPLTDAGDFKAFLFNRFGIAVKINDTTEAGTGYEGRITVLCNEYYAAIAYSAEKEAVLPVLRDLLVKRNLINQTDELISKLKKADSHIMLAAKNIVVSCDLESRQVKFVSEITGVDGLLIPAQSYGLQKADTGWMHFNINILPSAAFFKKQYKLNQYTIETDSLLKYWNGFANFEVKGMSKQKDTITTYEYDDNFKKTARQSIKTVSVPDMIISIGTDSRISTYLTRQQFITPEKKINKEIFPLYNFSAEQEARLLRFYTSPGPPEARQLTHNDHFMELSIDVKKMILIPELSFLKPYTVGINNIFAAGSKEKNKIVIEGNIEVDQNALKMLLANILSAE